MNVRQFLAVWTGALALVMFCALMTIARLDNHALVVGTSLIDRAMPEKDDTIADVLGGPFVKHIHRGTRRHEITRELELALKAGSEVVIVELSHFLYDRNAEARSERWLTGGWPPLRDIGHAVLAETRAVGLESLAQIGIERSAPGSRLDRKYRVTQAGLDDLFPLHPAPTRPADALMRAIIALKAAGTDIYLVVTPFSELAFDLAGDGVYAEIRQSGENIAAETGAPLFMQAGPWANDFYNDSFHLNRAGRQRFRDLFVNWLRTKREGSDDS